MPFTPGQSGNPEGRPKGSKNKVSEEVRLKIADFVNENFDTIKEDFALMKASYRWKFFVELLPYVAPKLSATDNRLSFEKLTDEDLNEIIENLTRRANEEA